MTDTGLRWKNTRRIRQFIVAAIFFNAMVVFFSVQEGLGVFKTPGSTAPVSGKVLVTGARCRNLETSSVSWWKRNLRIFGDLQTRSNSVGAARSDRTFLDLSPLSLFRFVGIVRTKIRTYDVSIARII